MLTNWRCDCHQWPYFETNGLFLLLCFFAFSMDFNSLIMYFNVIYTSLEMQCLNTFLLSFFYLINLLYILNSMMLISPVIIHLYFHALFHHIHHNSSHWSDVRGIPCQTAVDQLWQRKSGTSISIDLRWLCYNCHYIYLSLVKISILTLINYLIFAQDK
jgi:hypothetical protein